MKYKIDKYLSWGNSRNVKCAKCDWKEGEFHQKLCLDKSTKDIVKFVEVDREGYDRKYEDEVNPLFSRDGFYKLVAKEEEDINISVEKFFSPDESVNINLMSMGRKDLLKKYRELTEWDLINFVELGNTNPLIAEYFDSRKRVNAPGFTKVEWFDIYVLRDIQTNWRMKTTIRYLVIEAESMTIMDQEEFDSNFMYTRRGEDAFPESALIKMDIEDTLSIGL